MLERQVLHVTKIDAWLNARPAWLRWAVVISAGAAIAVVTGALVELLEPFDALAALLDYYDLPRPAPPAAEPTPGPPMLRWGY